MSVLIAIAAGIVVLGVLIFVHELGHFLAAKSVDIAVLRFSFGLGSPTRIGFTRGETHYCVSWIPFGGYVKMAGLEEEGAAGSLEGPREDAPVPPERTFDRKPLWARIYVISAGVFMNALFAVVVYAVLAASYGVSVDPTTTIGEVRADSLPMGAANLAALRPGDRILRVNGDTVRGWTEIQTRIVTADRTPIRIEVLGREAPILVDVPASEQEERLMVARALVPWREPVIGEVSAGNPAAAAGLARGDRVIRAGGDTVPSWERLVRIIERSAGQRLPLVVERAGRLLEMEVRPRALRVPVPGGGGSRVVGRIGVAPQISVRRYGPLGAVGEGFRQALAAGGLVLFTLKGLLLGQLSPRDIGGPILVAQLSGEVARLGLEPFLSFMALFSMNLAVLNLLPIPVLDGGHLVFLFVEGLRGRPLSVTQRQRLTQIGFFVLVGIMLWALANDVTRWIP
jgi:regulator of sigma E protease